MKNLRIHLELLSPLLAMVLLGSVQSACDNQLNISPTVPTFTEITTNVGSLRNLQISGNLESEQGSIVRATILFNGHEIQGARTRCDLPDGCADLDLQGVISSPTGRHTLTFKVLRQSEESSQYLASGSIEVTRTGIQLPDPAVIDLEPVRASLSAGEGITFEFELSD